MIVQLIQSSNMVVGTFSLSSVTAYGICRITNQPFINPKFDNERIVRQYTDVRNSISMILLQSIVITAHMRDRILDNSAHNLLQSVIAIFYYAAFIEFFYYIYHRSIHSQPTVYKLVHKKHHENTEVYPFDTFYFTYLDSLAFIGSVGLPLFIVDVTHIEHFFILYVYITSAYMSHSRICYDHHDKHHRMIFCNYCILLPFFDILCGTYK